MLNKFLALSKIKKTAIIFLLIVALFALAPLTVKVASAGEIDLYAMLKNLITRVDNQEARIAELESKLAKYKSQENVGQDNEEESVLDESVHEDEPAPVKGNDEPEDEDTANEGSTGGNVAPHDEATKLADDNDGVGERPAPESEPEPLPPLKKVDYYLSPQRSDWGRFEYVFQGTDLHVKYYVPSNSGGFEYAFTEVLDLTRIWEEDWGYDMPVLHKQLPINVVTNARRVGDTLKLDLLNWHGRNAPYEVRFPERQTYVLP